jgi:peptide/nickel transport system permease protein
VFRFIVRRALLAVLTLFAVSVATFGLFFAAPADPAEAMCGRNCSPEAVATARARLGVDRPMVAQYTDFMGGIVTGRTLGEGDLAVRCEAPCLGYSFRTGEPVTDIVARTVPVTVSIVLGAAVVWLLVGVSLGMFSAVRRGTFLDKAAVGISLAGASMQVYFFGLVLLLVFHYQLGWLPAPGYVSPFDDPGEWAAKMALPWATLGFLNSAIYARLARAQMLETLSEDFVRTARAKGLPTRTIHFRHALRAAITPLVTIAGLDIGGSLGGAVITEATFSVSGLGREAVRAVEFLNLPVIMATVLVAAAFIVLANVVVDVLYAVIDPRVKLS